MAAVSWLLPRCVPSPTSLRWRTVSGARRRVELVAVGIDLLTWEQIAEGFELRGQAVRLANQARGIFRSRRLSNGTLSIKTTEPRAAGAGTSVKVVYECARHPG